MEIWKKIFQNKAWTFFGLIIDITLEILSILIKT